MGNRVKRSPLSSVVFTFLLLAVAISPVQARVVRYDWTISTIQAAYDGVTSTVFGINGRSSSEALIDINLGDQVEVHVTNGLANATTCLHWHGFKQLGTQEMDGVSGITQCHIQPKATAVYRFTPDKAGTFWWHSHDKSQYAFGLRGPIVVHPRQARNAYQQRWMQYYSGVKGGIAAEYTLQMSDWYHAAPSGVPMWDTVLINSRGRFNCTVAQASNLTCSTDQPLTRITFQEGKTYLLRLINQAALAPLLFSIDGHQFSVIAADSEPVEPSTQINSLLINVGQRYDTIVKAKTASKVPSIFRQGQKSSVGSFWIRATAQYGTPWTGWPTGVAVPDGFNQYGLAILDYSTGGKSAGAKEPTSSAWTNISTIDEIAFWPSEVVTLPQTADKRVVLDFNLIQSQPNTVPLGYIAIDGGNYSTFVIPDEPPLFSIANGMKASSLPSSANVVSIEMGKHIEVVLVNHMSEQHPFHMHTHTPWVVASGQASHDAVFDGSISSLYRLHGPVKRDTYTVPPCNTNSDGDCVDVGYTVLRFDTDNPGAWLMHCHIEWHLDTGLAMLFVEGEEELQARGVKSFSSSMTSTCNGKYAV